MQGQPTSQRTKPANEGDLPIDERPPGNNSGRVDAAVNADGAEEGHRPGHRLARWARPSRAVVVFLWAVLLAAYAAVLFSYTWPDDLDRSGRVYTAITYLAFLVRTFLFHLGCAMLVVAMPVALARKWRPLLVSLPLMLFCLVPELHHYLPKTPPASSGTMRVLSYNLAFFTENHRFAVDEILKHSPDVVLLQEYTHAFDDFAKATLTEHFPYVLARPHGNDDAFGQAVYSRLPLETDGDGAVEVGDWDIPQLRAAVHIRGFRVVVYNIHVVPPADRGAHAETRRELSRVLEHVAMETDPVILGGDFNFTDRSPNAAHVRAAGLRDAHTLAGHGRGSTWPALGELRFAPGLRIDHIYLGEPLICTSFTVGQARGSDHRAIVADIGFAR